MVTMYFAPGVQEVAEVPSWENAKVIDSLMTGGPWPP
jgi:predicted butyrate kinase (DUF1464 family)